MPNIALLHCCFSTIIFLYISESMIDADKKYVSSVFLRLFLYISELMIDADKNNVSSVFVLFFWTTVFNLLLQLTLMFFRSLLPIWIDGIIVSSAFLCSHVPLYYCVWCLSGNTIMSVVRIRNFTLQCCLIFDLLLKSSL